jgi:ABC-type sugar transport system substrate-binding protein
VVKRFLVSLTGALVALAGAGAITPAAASAQSPSASDFVIGVVPQQELDRGDTQLMRSGSIE